MPLHQDSQPGLQAHHVRLGLIVVLTHKVAHAGFGGLGANGQGKGPEHENTRG